ncbi:MAG: hypothetical protein IKV35_06885, partial [Clostridia bacterium]|nr:hypothetical protein [Clostridia bacterium]
MYYTQTNAVDERGRAESLLRGALSSGLVRAVMIFKIVECALSIAGSILIDLLMLFREPVADLLGAPDADEFASIFGMFDSPILLDLIGTVLAVIVIIGFAKMGGKSGDWQQMIGGLDLARLGLLCSIPVTFISEGVSVVRLAKMMVGQMTDFDGETMLGAIVAVGFIAIIFGIAALMGLIRVLVLVAARGKMKHNAKVLAENRPLDEIKVVPRGYGIVTLVFGIINGIANVSGGDAGAAISVVPTIFQAIMILKWHTVTKEIVNPPAPAIAQPNYDPYAQPYVDPNAPTYVQPMPSQPY